MAFDLHIETRGGVEDLGRVIGVLALLGLTPLALTSYGDAEGLAIDLRIEASRRDLDLCLARLRALVATLSATAAASDPRGSGRHVPCATAIL